MLAAAPGQPPPQADASHGMEGAASSIGGAAVAAVRPYVQHGSKADPTSAGEGVLTFSEFCSLIGDYSQSGERRVGALPADELYLKQTCRKVPTAAAAATRP